MMRNFNFIADQANMMEWEVIEDGLHPTTAEATIGETRQKVTDSPGHNKGLCDKMGPDETPALRVDSLRPAADDHGRDKGLREQTDPDATSALPVDSSRPATDDHGQGKGLGEKLDPYEKIALEVSFAQDTASGREILYKTGGVIRKWAAEVAERNQVSVPGALCASALRQGGAQQSRPDGDFKLSEVLATYVWPAVSPRRMSAVPAHLNWRRRGRHKVDCLTGRLNQFMRKLGPCRIK